jgi:hypothetical protein
MSVRVALVFLILTVTGAMQAAGQDRSELSPRLSTTAPSQATHDLAPAPILSHEIGWAKQMLIGLGGLFLVATVFGVIYRRSLPDELRPIHAHDEPPGASEHHGPSGTVDYSSPDGE